MYQHASQTEFANCVPVGKGPIVDGFHDNWPSLYRKKSAKYYQTFLT